MQRIFQLSRISIKLRLFQSNVMLQSLYPSGYDVCRRVSNLQFILSFDIMHLHGVCVDLRTKQQPNHFYWPTNALNCIKLNRLNSTWINIL